MTPGARPGAAVLRLRQDIDRLLAAPPLEHGTWGVHVRSLARSDTLYSFNARKLLMPASTMKLVTLAAAADRLGWDYTYETRVLGIGAIEAGTLQGDLLVVGSGDPSIDNWDGFAAGLFQEWAERLHALGIRTVAGRIVGDDNAFEDDALGAGWAWDDLSASFATGVGALQFNQNTARLMVAPGAAVGDPSVVQMRQATSGLMLRNLVTTSPAEVPPSLALRRMPGSTTLELRGSVPIENPPIARNVSVDNPTLYFASELREAFVANGIEVRGEAVDIDAIDDAPTSDVGGPLVVHRSPPLSTLATTMMKLSQNLYAETLLKTLGGPSAGGTSASGRIAVQSVLQDWGIPPGSLFIADGSGLSRYNLATAEALVTILARVDADQRLRSEFQATLPVAGRDGTLSQRMKGTAGEGNARAKTGALSNARALAGYVTTADGEPLAFAILANNFGTAADIVEETMDAIVVRLAEFRR